MPNPINKYYENETQYTMELRKCDMNANILVLHVNAQSCANFKTFDSIRLFASECDGKIDIIIVSETWFRACETNIFNIDGYVNIHSCRIGRPGGGLSIYVRSPCKIVDAEIISNSINAVCIELVNYRGLDKL